MLSSPMWLKIAWSGSQGVLVSCPAMVANSKVSKRPSAFRDSYGSKGVKATGYHAHKTYFFNFAEIRCVKVFSPTEDSVAYLYYEFDHKGEEFWFRIMEKALKELRKKSGLEPTELADAIPHEYARKRLEILMPALEYYIPCRAGNFNQVKA